MTNSFENWAKKEDLNTLTLGNFFTGYLLEAMLNLE